MQDIEESGYRRWTEEEKSELVRLYYAATPYTEIARRLNRSVSGVAYMCWKLRLPKTAAGRMVRSAPGRPGSESEVPWPPSPSSPVGAAPPPDPVVSGGETPRGERAADVRRRVSEAAMHAPVDTAPLERIRTLEARVAELQAQLVWAQRADSSVRTGGKFTLRASDHHYGDANHLLSCGAQLEAKTCILLEQYKPSTIQIIAGDDWIAGRGVYKEQDLDMVASDIQAQIEYGAMKAYLFLKRLREVSSAPILWRMLRGNHDAVYGTSMTESLFFAMKNIASDIPDVRFEMNWDVITANLAAVGTYNALVRHGFGYSKISPTSPAFIDAVRDEILVKQRKMQPEEHYRRVISGHTHFLSVGIERQIGLFWDTTGGLQRNTRIRLGANQRPVGWIVYIGPPDLENNILAPIALSPDNETYEREIADPHLHLQNHHDVATCIRQYLEILRDRGDYGPADDYGVAVKGRW